MPISYHTMWLPEMETSHTVWHVLPEIASGYCTVCIVCFGKSHIYEWFLEKNDETWSHGDVLRLCEITIAGSWKKHSAATRSCSSTKCVRRDDGVDQPWPMGPIPKSLIVVSFYMFLSPWPIRLGWLANMIFPSCCFWNFDQLLRPPAQVPMRSANVHSIRVLQTCLTQGIQIYIKHLEDLVLCQQLVLISSLPQAMGLL